MACVHLDISILDLPEDADPWKGMSYQEIVDAQAAQVEAWNADLEAEIEQLATHKTP